MWRESCLRALPATEDGNGEGGMLGVRGIALACDCRAMGEPGGLLTGGLGQ